MAVNFAKLPELLRKPCGARHGELQRARTQRFHNGGAIHGTIQSGVTVSGFGLKRHRCSIRGASARPNANAACIVTTTLSSGAAMAERGCRPRLFRQWQHRGQKKGRAVRRSYAVPTAKRLRSASGQ